MKKFAAVLLGFLLLMSTVNIAVAKAVSNSALSTGIRAYKSGNYVQSYTIFNDIVKKDPSNALAYYYLAISCVQVGRKSEAIDNYEKVLNLSPRGQLKYYALKGKTCLESPDKCNELLEGETDMDKFIRSRFGTGFSKEVRSDYEKHKIENLMREMNRGKDISPQEFKDYKDFSSEVPTNDEIVAALRTLQNAGLGGYIGNNYGSDFSFLTGEQNNSSNDMLRLLLGNQKSGNTNLSPQVIQAMLSSQMYTGF